MYVNRENLIIISRYKEDISWAKQLNGDIVIYNKDDKWPWDDIPRIDAENYGREGETFVRAILEFYQNLTQYDNVIFLQGNPFEHCKDVLNRINNNVLDDILHLTDSYTLDSYPDDYYFEEKHISIIDQLLQIKSIEMQAIVKDNNPDEINRIPDHNHAFLFEETMGLCTVLGISYKAKKVCWATGGQYIIPVRYILNKNEKWWTNLHNLFNFYSKIKKIESLSYILERIWPLVWEHSET